MTVPFASALRDLVEDVADTNRNHLVFSGLKGKGQKGRMEPSKQQRMQELGTEYNQAILNQIGS